MQKLALLRLLPERRRRLVFSLLPKLTKHLTGHRGRPLKFSVLSHLIIFITKCKTNMSYRHLEALTTIPYVTLSRMVMRCAEWLNQLSLGSSMKGTSLRVDTTTVRLGKGSCTGDYTGHKHYRGLKFQVCVDAAGCIIFSSSCYSASWHDKRVFVHECGRNTEMHNYVYIGDKAYLGIKKPNVFIPEKRNHIRYKKYPAAMCKHNHQIAQARIVVEHVFASIKANNIFYTAFYFARDRISLIFNACCRLHNEAVAIRLKGKNSL